MQTTSWRDGLQELMDAVCLRPSMFTAHGTYSEVAAFIDGFAAGRGMDMDKEMFDFGIWIAEHFEMVPRNLVWWGHSDSRTETTRLVP